jgi:hypothetical protein
VRLNCHVVIVLGLKAADIEHIAPWFEPAGPMCRRQGPGRAQYPFREVGGRRASSAKDRHTLGAMVTAGKHAACSPFVCDLGLGADWATLFAVTIAGSRSVLQQGRANKCFGSWAVPNRLIPGFSGASVVVAGREIRARGEGSPWGQRQSERSPSLRLLQLKAQSNRSLTLLRQLTDDRTNDSA